MDTRARYCGSGPVSSLVPEPGEHSGRLRPRCLDALADGVDVHFRGDLVERRAEALRCVFPVADVDRVDDVRVTRRLRCPRDLALVTPPIVERVDRPQG